MTVAFDMDVMLLLVCGSEMCHDDNNNTCGAGIEAGMIQGNVRCHSGRDETRQGKTSTWHFLTLRGNVRCIIKVESGE